MSRIKLKISDIKRKQLKFSLSDFIDKGNWNNNNDGLLTYCSNLSRLTLRHEIDDVYTLWIDFNPSKYFFHDNLYEYCINKSHIIELRDYIESKGVRISLESLLTAPINYYEAYRIILIYNDEKTYLLHNIYTNLYKPQNSIYKVSYGSNGEGVNTSTKHKMLSIYDKSAEISKTNPDIVKDLESKNLTAFKIETKFSKREECNNIAKTYFNEDHLTLELLINNPNLRQRIIKDYWQSIIKYSLDLNTSKIPLLINKIHKDKTIHQPYNKELCQYFLFQIREYGYAYALQSIKKR